jgi:LacI family transcriptional regulator
MIGLHCVLSEKGYNILVAQSNESFTTETKNISLFENNMVDGFIISVAKDSEDISGYERLINKGFPLVFFNRVPENLTASKVIIDDRKWGYKATEHLILQGCKQIAHLSGRDNLSVSRNRKQGYLDALKDYNMPIDENLIVECGVMMEKGVIGALNLLKRPQLPDGLFAVTDPVAIGAMKTFMKHGVRIPEDIAVVGFTESPSATIIEPNLTSVQQPTYEIGVKAAELLLAQIVDINHISQTIILDAELNIKDSSLCKPYREVSS